MYLVANSRAVKIKGVIYKAGSEITTEMMEEKEIKGNIEAGFITDTRSAPPLAEVTPGQVSSKYKLNPEDLRSKSLQELNLLVIEKDASVVPFETAPEAIAHLSADYVDPTATAPVVTT